jgi:FtsZ-binding cell division protein ZapB
MDNSSIVPIMAAATTGLTGAVAALWKHQVKQSDKIEKKHDQAINNIADLSREVGELKGRIHLAEKISPKIDELAEQVIEALNNGDPKNQ